MTYKNHPISSIFPMATNSELAEFTEDIRKRGLFQPVWLFEGQILDGRKRAVACERAGRELRTREFVGIRSEALAFVWSQNFVRRHLSPSQAAASIELRKRQDAEFAAEIQKLAAETEAERRKKIGEARRSETAQLVAPSQKTERQTSTKIAKAAGTNRRYIEVAAKLSDADLADLRDGKRNVNDLIMESKRADLQAKYKRLAEEPIKKYKGVFDVIIVDPPWPLVDQYINYPTMKIEKIASLEIPAANDCFLFLWTTQKFLLAARNILKKWGFRYCCTMVWHKDKGRPATNLPMFNCEFCILARRGKPEFLYTNFQCCFNAPRRKHSEKPIEFFKEIRRVTCGRRLSMFERKQIDGFTCWGNEMPKNVRVRLRYRERLTSEDCAKWERGRSRRRREKIVRERLVG